MRDIQVFSGFRVTLRLPGKTKVLYSHISGFHRYIRLITAPHQKINANYNYRNLSISNHFNLAFHTSTEPNCNIRIYFNYIRFIFRVKYIYTASYCVNYPHLNVK